MFERVQKSYKKNEFGLFERAEGKGLTTNTKSWTFWRGRNEFFYDGFPTGRKFNTELKVSMMEA